MWIEPLDLQTWFVQVFSGSMQIFTAIALMIIVGMAGYFRMNIITMFFMIGMFTVLFSQYIGSAFYTLIALVSSLLIGFWISRIVGGR